jgi:hypothetical protein
LAPKDLKIGDKIKNEGSLQNRSLKGKKMKEFFKNEMENS